MMENINLNKFQKINERELLQFTGGKKQWYQWFIDMSNGINSKGHRFW